MDTASPYTDKYLQGMQVSHAVSDFGEGSTTILTLTDHSISNDEKENKKDEHMNVLETVNLIDTSKANDNLKQKRKLDMGMGHAGGYAGYDDDEFEELGGAQTSMAATEQVKL